MVTKMNDVYIRSNEKEGYNYLSKSKYNKKWFTLYKSGLVISIESKKKYSALRKAKAGEWVTVSNSFGNLARYEITNPIYTRGDEELFLRRWKGTEVIGLYLNPRHRFDGLNDKLCVFRSDWHHWYSYDEVVEYFPKLNNIPVMPYYFPEARQMEFNFKASDFETETNRFWSHTNKYMNPASLMGLKTLYQNLSDNNKTIFASKMSKILNHFEDQNATN